jgi:hypothetical protein
MKTILNNDNRMDIKIAKIELNDLFLSFFQLKKIYHVVFRKIKILSHFSVDHK